MDNNERNQNNQGDTGQQQGGYAAESNQPNYSEYQPYNNGYYSAPQEELAPPKQSKLGIASFIISLAAILLIIIGFISAFSFAAEIAGNEDLLADPYAYSENLDPELFVPVIVMLVCFVASVGVAVIGVVLGIISVASKNVRKAFGITGLILNSLIVLGTLGLIVFSVALASSV